ncbi:MAG: PilZ domain-containing protein [Polyangiaceae bacterium]
MARPVSGTFRRADRVNASAGTTVRLTLQERGREYSATLLELGMSDLLLAAAPVPELGTRVSVAITLTERFIQFEIPGMVSWHRDGHFGVSFDDLTTRQTYALVLAIDLLRTAADAAAPALTGFGER